MTCSWKLILVALPAMLALAWYAFVWRMEHARLVIRQRMEARHAERERIARDLHDTLLQGIQALLLRLQVWAGDATLPAERRSEIATVVLQAREIVVEGRERILALRRADLECEDLLESLTELGSTESAGQVARFEMTSNGQQRPLISETCQQLIDIGREAIRNAHRHARASHVVMTVDYRNSSLRMRIVDDGRGIDPEVLRAGHRRGHFGLVGMRERATQLGAHFSIESDRIRGTRITVTVPGGVAFVDRWKWPWQARRHEHA